MERIYENKTQNERLELLNANCLKKEEQSIKVFYSEDDLIEMKSRLSENSIERNELENELKELSSSLRLSIKTKTKKIKDLLLGLKNKYEYQMQTIFEFDDQENKVMLTYNASGELINSRPLRPNERQTSIINLNQKTA